MLALDLDGVVWDCEDVSLTTPPYNALSDGVIVDSEGTVIRLREHVKEFLEFVISEGGISSTLSWNKPGIAL